MYIYKYVHIHIYIYIHMYVYIHIYVYMNICIYMYIYMHIYIYMCSLIPMYLYTYIHTYIQKHIGIYTYTYMLQIDTNIHTHNLISRFFFTSVNGWARTLFSSEGHALSPPTTWVRRQTFQSGQYLHLKTIFDVLKFEHYFGCQSENSILVSHKLFYFFSFSVLFFLSISLCGHSNVVHI